MVTGIGTVVMQQQMMNGGSPVSSEPAKRASDNRRVSFHFVFICFVTVLIFDIFF